MGTRSVIAVPDADHGFKGRYVHWDGYPTGVGDAVREYVNRDGYEQAVKTLTEENYGWSSLGKAELSQGYTDARFRAVENYGVAYTTEGGQSSADKWLLGDDDDWGTEWAYVLHPDHIDVFERTYTPDTGGGHMTGMWGQGAEPGAATWVKRGEVAYDDEDGMTRTEGQ